MTVREVRRRAKRRIEGLSEERLQAADHYLACLEQAESIAATEELLAIPGFLEAFEEGCRDAEEGRLTPFEDIRWKE